MVKMMGWTAKVKDTVSYAAMTTESSALEYRLLWEMNRPAQLTLLVNDDSGAKTQTYGDAYMGTSAVVIEQPTNTEIFRGRLVAAEAGVQSGVLTLRGADWLSQLEDRLVHYDTREILDPNVNNNLREYHLNPFLNQGARCNALVEAGGNTDVRLDDADLGVWNANDYNTCKLCFPYTYMGEQLDTCYPYDETVTGWGTKNTDAGSEIDVWEEEGSNFHEVEYTRAGLDVYYQISYYFKSLAKSSTLVNSIDAMRVTVVYEVTNDGGTAAIGLWNYNTANVESIGSLEDIGSEYNKVTIEVPKDKIDDANFWSTGMFRVCIYDLIVGGGTIGVKIDYIHVEIDYTVDTALTTQYTIDDSGDQGAYVQLDLDGDTLVTDGVCDWWKFHIADKLTVHVTALVGACDELYALDATSDVTASTNYVGRHYHYMKPMAILQDWAQIDGTDFWLNPWDGDSLDLVWNSTYAVGGAPVWTDSTVLSWVNPSRILQDVINQWIVEGYVSGDYKVQEGDTDAASIAAYGQRSGLFNNPDIGSNLDADIEADARVDRTKDLPFHVVALINGFSTVTLGSVVEVNSSKLGIADASGDEYYVLTRKEYDSRTARSTMYLTPRDGTNYTLNKQKMLDNLFRDVKTRIYAMESRTERGPRYQQTW